MKAWYAVLLVVAATVTVASLATAGTHSAAQRVAFSLSGLPDGRFSLSTLETGPLKSDSGTTCLARTSKPCASPSVIWPPDRVVMRAGQSVEIYLAYWTFTSKRGTIVIRERSEWVDAGGAPPWAAIGTWKVVRGTGDYAGVTGSGRSGHAGLGARWFARYEGFLSLR